MDFLSPELYHWANRYHSFYHWICANKPFIVPTTQLMNFNRIISSCLFCSFWVTVAVWCIYVAYMYHQDAILWSNKLKKKQTISKSAGNGIVLIYSHLEFGLMLFFFLIALASWFCQIYTLLGLHFVFVV